jgi:hypothetical protein
VLALLIHGQRLCRFADQMDQLDSLASSTSGTTHRRAVRSRQPPLAPNPTGGRTLEGQTYDEMPELARTA